ncbi:hypothetical protein BGZ93_010116 [Podila epicladia]|nr:hypothetical protein BGZ92_009506 [Podila epicladia]KAG0098861.1 hypothetical protein BGZ93_010116 [Podila epicladia]
MLVKNLAIVAGLASAAMAQAVGSIFCQARFITNVATCVIGVTECNVVERFSACVCSNTQDKPKLRQCLVALISDQAFRGTLLASDYRSLLSVDTMPEAEASSTGAGDSAASGDL